MNIKFKSFFWPIIIISLAWFVFAHPYFLLGKVPYASQYQVNFFPPWSHYEKFRGPIKNNAMPDIHEQIYPWKKFTIEQLKQGRLPLWNPYNFSGNPHLANFQSAVLSPFNLLFFIFPFIDAWSLLILLQPLIAGVSTYFLMRSFHVSKPGALLSSIIFMFCGFIVVWMAYGTLAMAISFLPTALFAIEKSFNKTSLRILLLLAVIVPLSFFSGHFQTSLYFLIFLWSYFIYKTLITKAYKNAVSVCIALLFGLIFSLPQLLPSIQFYQHSVRSEIFIQGGGIPFHYLITIFAPDFFGNPVTRNDWFGFYAEWVSFIGITPLLLSLYGLIKMRNSHTLFFFFASILSLILAIDSPIHAVLGGLQIPVLSTSAPARIIVLFSFSLAVMAGFGFDNLRSFLSKKEKSTLVPLVLIGGLLLGIWILLLVGNILPDDKVSIAKRNLLLPSLFFGISTVIIATLFFFRKATMFLLYLLLFVAAFDSMRFAQKWMPFDNRALVYPGVPIISAIEKHIGNGRFFGNLGAEVATYYGFPSVEGYDPLYIGRYGEFIRGAAKGDVLKGERSVVKLDRRGQYTDRVLDLLGVSLIFHPIADTNQGWAYPVWDNLARYELLYRDDKFQLFKNKEALKRATIFYQFEVITDSNILLKKFYSKDFNFREILLLEEEVPITPSDSKGIAEIVQYTPGRILIRTKSDAPGLLFLADNFFPGWRVKVNGKTEKIYRADYSFRAVVIPSGSAEVEFTYNLF